MPNSPVRGSCWSALGLFLAGTLAEAQEPLEVFIPAPADPAGIEARLREDPATAGWTVRVHGRADAAALALADPKAAGLVPAFLGAALPTWQRSLAGRDASGTTVRYRILRLTRSGDSPLRSVGMVAEADQRTSVHVIARIAPPLAPLRLRRFATLESLVNALAMEVVDAGLVSPEQATWLSTRYRTPLTVLGEADPLPLPGLLIRGTDPNQGPRILGLVGLTADSLTTLGLTGLAPVEAP